MYTISLSGSSISSKVCKAKENAPLKCITYKKIRIARKIKCNVGMPKPLSIEEDFVLEKNNSTVEFLNPLSGYYKLPELGDYNKKSQSSFNEKMNLRHIVGSVEDFRKIVSRQKGVNSGDNVKKNQHSLTFTSQSIKKPGFIFPGKPKVKILKEDYMLSMNEGEILQNKHVTYWDVVSNSIPNKIDMKKKTGKIKGVKWYELKDINIFS